MNDNEFNLGYIKCDISVGCWKYIFWNSGKTVPTNVVQLGAFPMLSSRRMPGRKELE